MFNRRIVSGLIACAMWAVASPSVTSQSGRLAITRVSVVDVVTGDTFPNSTVVIDGETITAVVSGGTPPADARVMDGTGKFVIPGLWDMHAHLQVTGEASLQLNVANGVTGVRDMGADLDFILDLRDATKSRRILGPEVIAAGPILDDAPGDWPLRMRVQNAGQGREAVRLLKRRGVDVIKVHNYTPRDAFFGIADEARLQNLPLTGHVPLKVTVQEGIEAGMRTIEHLSEDGKVWKTCSGDGQYQPETCRALFETFARANVWQTPTLATLGELAVAGTPASRIDPEHLAYAGKQMREMWAGNQRTFVTRPEIIDILKRLAEVAMVVTRDMASAGVGILAGCDALIAGFCVHDELAAMVQSGMTPLAALQTATINPARHLGREQTDGSVAPGKVANLVLLDANPLSDISNVRRVWAVAVRGRLLERAELDQILVQTRLAAQR